MPSAFPCGYRQLLELSVLLCGYRQLRFFKPDTFISHDIRVRVPYRGVAVAVKNLIILIIHFNFYCMIAWKASQCNLYTLEFMEVCCGPSCDLFWKMKPVHWRRIIILLCRWKTIYMWIYIWMQHSVAYKKKIWSEQIQTYNQRLEDNSLSK